MENKEIELMREEIKELKEKLQESQQLIMDISVPVIPSIVPETILIPITGKLSSERFEMIISKIMDISFEEINYIIIDFTSISKDEIGEIGVFGHYIDNLTNTLALIGVETIYVGFTPYVTQTLINSGLTLVKELTTFLSFRQALQYLMKKKGLVMQNVE